MGPRVIGALIAMTVGASTGVAMLVLAYAPSPFDVAPRQTAEHPPADSNRPAADKGLASTRPVRPSQPPAHRASKDERAARERSSKSCPSDMALVEGSQCPSLAYTCAKKSGFPGHGCPEYARGARCAEPVRPRRFCIDRHEWPNRVGEAPAVYVDWNQAKSECEAVGKRLCARSEWTLACEGPKRLPYPWGFTRWPSPCNIDRTTVPFDASAIDRPESRDTELARLWQADPIGSHPDCVSAYGVYDLTGNVDEWTDDTLDNPDSAHPSTLSGGYWGPVRNTCRLTTTSHGPSFKFYQVGFRCCADAPGREG